MKFKIGNQVVEYNKLVESIKTSTLKDLSAGKDFKVIEMPSDPEGQKEFKEAFAAIQKAEVAFGKFGVILGQGDSIELQEILFSDLTIKGLPSNKEIGTAVFVIDMSAGQAYRWYDPTTQRQMIGIATEPHSRIVSMATRKGENTVDDNIRAMALLERHYLMERTKALNEAQREVLMANIAAGVPEELAYRMSKDAIDNAAEKFTENRIERKQRRTVNISGTNINQQPMETPVDAGDADNSTTKAKK